MKQRIINRKPTVTVHGIQDTVNGGHMADH